MYFGLDISTRIIGWSLMDHSGSLKDWGYIEYPQKTKKRPALTLFQKMDYLEGLQDKLRVYKDDIDAWGVEEAVKKFQGGKSTANTIYTCASFNFGVAHSFYKFFGFEPIYIPVSTARKTVDLKIPRGLDKYSRKSEVVEWCKPRYPTINWVLTKTGKFKPWCFDVADSLVITEATRRIHGRNLSRAI